jgi:hypothetical protein
VPVVPDTNGMNPRPSAIASGVAWIILSPLAFFMAAISTVKSLNVYYVQLLVFGAWTAAGVLSGIGTIASAAWARRLKTTLLCIAGAYCAGAFAIGAVAMVVVGSVDPVFALITALALTAIAAPFAFLAIRRRRSNEQRATDGTRTMNRTLAVATPSDHERGR